MDFLILKKNFWRLFISLLIFVSILAVYSTKSAKADVVYATDGIDYLQVDSPIVVEFDQEIQFSASMQSQNPGTPNPGFTDIRLIDVTDPQSPSPVSIRLDIDGNKLMVIPDPGVLSPNADFQLEITNDIVLSVSTLSNPNPEPVFDTQFGSGEKITYFFSTESLSFFEFIRGGGEIMDIINDYTPEEIHVTAPVRYIKEMEIVHMRRGMKGSDTESVTNLSIKLDDSGRDVARIVVKANGKEKELEYLDIGTAQSSYDFAFVGLPDSGYDVQISAYDEDDEPLDSRIIKMAPSGNKASTVRKEKNKYRMAGRTFTLHHLMEKGKDLQRLLNENDLDELKVQVKEK